MIKLGEKIKTLRKQKNISQEILANYLGVSFQAVSKWETGSTMPDVTLIPAIAAFFGVSTDELFDYNVFMVEKQVEAIVEEHRKYWNTDKATSEKVLREGLKKYPGNDILLNCLIGVIPVPERSAEVIELCKSLIECTRCDEVKYDAYRILAEAYKSIGEYALAKTAVGNIPELYFTKLGLEAELMDGEDILLPAEKQKWISFDETVRMYERLADYYEKRNDVIYAVMQLEIILNLIDAVKDDMKTQFHTCSLYECYSDRIPKIEARIKSLTA